MAPREAVHRALSLYLRDATFFRDAWDQKVRELRRVAESTPWLLKFPIVNDGSTESLRNDILIMQCLIRY